MTSACSTGTVPSDPVHHFKLWFYTATLTVIQRASEALGSYETASGRYPFLAQYCSELATLGLEGIGIDRAPQHWNESVEGWERSTSGHLPLRALRESAALERESLALVLAAGLVEEDARFGFLFDDLQGTTGHRPTAGLLQAWFTGANLRQLLELGVVEIPESDAPRSTRTIRVPALVWDAIRSEHPVKPASWLHYRQVEELTPLADIVLPEEALQQVEALPALLCSGELGTVVIRGPQNNGRRTLLGAVARMLGRGVLEMAAPNRPDDEKWRLMGPLATLLHAMPVLKLDLTPGESIELPSIAANSPVGIVLGRFGGVGGAIAERSVTISLGIPDLEERRRHWQAATGTGGPGWLDRVTERFRMTSGNIRRTGRLASAYSMVEARDVTVGDVREACKVLNRQALDKFAKHLKAAGDWTHLAVAPQTASELYYLESRCRHRERLKNSVGPAVSANLNSGVRALFAGPSGTGKTLAAQLLAAALQMDLYRLDLSTVVNKYIGETEKHLDQVFSRAEELDVVLLLDEGDALLTQRTNVQSSNDRYANLETNYLIQRLDSFEGILVVTTNAANRIDTAFQRRMDVIVHFRMPEPAERLSIWQMHLPGNHAVDPGLLNDVANRCALTGGQIRNAALHASLLAINDGGLITSGHLESSVQREYTKNGAVCPLPRAYGAGGW